MVYSKNGILGIHIAGTSAGGDYVYSTVDHRSVIFDEFLISKYTIALGYKPKFE